MRSSGAHCRLPALIAAEPGPRKIDRPAAMRGLFEQTSAERRKFAQEPLRQAAGHRHFVLGFKLLDRRAGRLVENARRLDLGEVNPAWSFWIDVSVGAHGEIAFPGSTADRPTELYYCENSSAKPRRLTDFNSDVASLNLGKMEVIEWAGPDNFPENGMLTYPPGFRPGTKLPLVLYIHGGPWAASTTSFSAFSQLVAAHGYLVFSPNYRGSDNLGDRCAVAQAEIKPLCADRRNDMGRFADERDAVTGERIRRFNRQREDAATGLNTHRAEQRVRTPLDFGR